MTCVVDNVVFEKVKEATREINIKALILTNKEEWLGNVEVTPKKTKTKKTCGIVIE